MKQRKLEKALEAWEEVNDCKVPSNEAVKSSVAQHNANYFIEENRMDGLASDWARSNGHGQSSYRGHAQGSIVVVGHTKTNDEWTCPVEDLKGCPIAAKPQVEVPLEMWNTWIELAGEFDTEWFANLIGDVNPETGRARITEMYFPPQKASGAHVEIPEDSTFRPRPGTIAAVHSHVKMNAFFSQTDIDHANWPVEIVVNAYGKYDLRMRVKLECGRYSRVEGKVVLVGIKQESLAAQALRAALSEDKGSPAALAEIGKDEHDKGEGQSVLPGYGEYE